MKRFVSPLALEEASERLLSIHGSRLPGIFPIGVKSTNTLPEGREFDVYGEEAFFPPFKVRLYSQSDTTNVHILTRSIWLNRFTLSLVMIVIIVTLGTYLFSGEVQYAGLVMLTMSIGVFLFSYIFMGMQFELVRLIRYILAGSVTELDPHFWQQPNFNLTIPSTLETAHFQLSTIENYKVNNYKPEIRFWHPHPNGQRYDIDLDVISARGLRISIEMDGYLRILDNGYIQIVGRWKYFWLSKFYLFFYFVIVLYGLLQTVLEILFEGHIPDLLGIAAGIFLFSSIAWDVQRAKDKLITLIKDQLGEIPNFNSINRVE